MALLREHETLKRIQEWYSLQCNGDWEHRFGVDINTLDNPGWMVKIALDNTELEDKPFSKVKLERSENDWVHCWIENGKFEGAGGQHNLEEILNIFLDWSVSATA